MGADVMAWEKKPAIKSGGPACACCGTPTDAFPMDGWIAVGFGDATVTRDGRAVYSELDDTNGEDGIWTGADAERAAAEDPDHDWRITFRAALYDAVYQRHLSEQWVLIERGDGFA
jgi:hypothetical protein